MDGKEATRNKTKTLLKLQRKSETEKGRTTKTKPFGQHTNGSLFYVYTFFFDKFPVSQWELSVETDGLTSCIISNFEYPSK